MLRWCLAAARPPSCPYCMHTSIKLPASLGTATVARLLTRSASVATVRHCAIAIYCHSECSLTSKASTTYWSRSAASRTPLLPVPYAYVDPGGSGGPASPLIGTAPAAKVAYLQCSLKIFTTQLVCIGMQPQTLQIINRLKHCNCTTSHCQRCVK